MSDLIDRQALLKHLEEKSGMNTPLWLVETINEMPSLEKELNKYMTLIDDKIEELKKKEYWEKLNESLSHSIQQLIDHGYI
jgi:hypothetical protein